jgi:hypothetical protein
MQPLVEVLFGKSALSGSSAQAKGYQKYGPDRSGNMKSDIELSSSRAHRRKRGDTSYEDALRSLDAKDSQETILRQGQCEDETTVATKPSYSGGIVRTDVFAVTYETERKGDCEAPSG